MITLDKLKPNMIFKFVSPYMIDSSLDHYDPMNPIILIVKSITPHGPMISNYNKGFNHGVLTLYEYFHKFNTPEDKVKNDLLKNIG